MDWPVKSRSLHKVFKSFEFFFKNSNFVSSSSISKNLFNLLTLNHPFYDNLSILCRFMHSENTKLLDNYK